MIYSNVTRVANVHVAVLYSYMIRVAVIYSNVVWVWQ